MRPAGPKRKPRTGRGSPEHALTHSFDSSGANSVQIAGPKGSDRKSGRRWCGRRQDQLLHLLRVQKPEVRSRSKSKDWTRRTLEDYGREHASTTQEPAFLGWSDAQEESTVEGVTRSERKSANRSSRSKPRSPPGVRRETDTCEVPHKRRSRLVHLRKRIQPVIGAAEGATRSRHCLRFPEAPRYNEQELITGEP
jgi:hypothetical protein